MPINDVQQTNGSAAAATVSANFTLPPAVNNLLVAGVYADIGVAADVNISGWSVADQQGGSANAAKIFYKIAALAESSTVTATGTGATAMRLHVAEVSGINTATPLDRTGVATSGTTNVFSLGLSVLTTNVPEEYLFGFWGLAGNSGGGESVTNGFTIFIGGAGGRAFSARRIVTSTGAYSTTGSWTTTRRARGVLATFRGLDVAPPASVTQNQLIV